MLSKLEDILKLFENLSLAKDYKKKLEEREFKNIGSSFINKKGIIIETLFEEWTIKFPDSKSDIKGTTPKILSEVLDVLKEKKMV